MVPVENLLFALTLVAALGCGLVAGVFFAFSAFVMKALTRLPTGAGMAAMQSINVVVLNPWFLTVFFGTAAACVLALVASLLQWHEAGAACLLAGSVLYLAGTLLVTILFNVPRNEALAKVAPADPDGARLWALRRRLDGLEPRAHGGGACRGRIVQCRTRLLNRRRPRFSGIKITRDRPFSQRALRTP